MENTCIIVEGNCIPQNIYDIIDDCDNRLMTLATTLYVVAKHLAYNRYVENVEICCRVGCGTATTSWHVKSYNGMSTIINPDGSKQFVR